MGRMGNSVRSWEDVVREYRRRHPHDPMTRKRAQKIEKEALPKLRRALGLPQFAR